MAPATAQDTQQIRLFEEIDRLRKDIGDLQRQVYQGGAQPQAGATVGSESTDRAARFEVRLGQIEEQMRSLTGLLEGITHDIQGLDARIDQLVADVDSRLRPIEQSRAGAGPQAAAAPAPAALPPSTQVAAPPAFAPAPAVQGAAPAAPATAPPASDSTTLSELLYPQPAVEAAPSAKVALAPAAPGAVPESSSAALPPGTPEQQYDFAFDLLRRRDWEGAEGALRAFIDAHPDDELTGNAYYWLAETFYVRNDLEQAAVYFARGYQDFPDSLKAPANLLKLGMSLARIGRTNDACLTFQELGERFPNASPSEKQRAAAEGQRAGCS
jgi:tol-pal system protein YbgF